MRKFALFAVLAVGMFFLPPASRGQVVVGVGVGPYGPPACAYC